MVHTTDRVHSFERIETRLLFKMKEAFLPSSAIFTDHPDNPIHLRKIDRQV
jgi:hypothetical protein